MSERLSTRIAWVIAVAAALTFAWVWRAARLPDDLPVARPVAGPPLVAVPRASTAGNSTAEDGPVETWLMPSEGDTIDFARLAFVDYDPPELRGPGAHALVAADFPEPARVIDGLRLRVEGFPQALEIEDGEVQQLLFTRFAPGCCFGAIPVLDEWILVQLEEPLDALELPPFGAVSGVLEVAELLDETGAASSLYRLRGAELSDD